MNKKKTILMLCDHPLATSGVGTQARWLINGLVETGKYSFRVFGGAVRHENYNQITVNEDFVIKPTDGFGNKNLLRVALTQLKPDALLLFTDPRFFMWVWDMEEEVHQVCPISYNHLWDNPPWPEFNRHIYESTDLINCINWPTYEMVSQHFPEKTNYIPHGVPQKLFKPLPETERIAAKKEILGESRSDHFVTLFVSRNARRKMTSDVLVSWKMFLDDLRQKYGHERATLVLHTDPKDTEGPNLNEVSKMLGIENKIIFSKGRLDFGQISKLYNIADVVVNRSCNEGFGLGILEAKMCGKPVIAIKTGGLTRQIVDHETGEEFGVALDPEISPLVGTQNIPYIHEDFVSNRTFTNAIMKLYEMPKEKREELGLRAMNHAHKNYNLESVVESWDKSLMNCIEGWKSSYKRWENIEL
jgi:glycosyltransferase involved in cell wall biosynthesis